MNITAERSTFSLDRSLPALFGFVVLTFLAAVPAFWLDPSYYAALEKPAWAPPAWVFGPVWTVLYVLIGTSGWLVWRTHGWSAPMKWWVVQLVLNALWTPLFFGFHQPGWAFWEINVLWLSMVGTMALFARCSATAAWLLLPYCAWVSFATLLTGAIWELN